MLFEVTLGGFALKTTETATIQRNFDELTSTFAWSLILSRGKMALSIKCQCWGLRIIVHISTSDTLGQRYAGQKPKSNLFICQVKTSMLLTANMRCLLALTCPNFTLHLLSINGNTPIYLSIYRFPHYHTIYHVSVKKFCSHFPMLWTFPLYICPFLPLPIYFSQLFSPLCCYGNNEKRGGGGFPGLAGLQHFWAMAWCLIALLIHINAARCVPPNPTGASRPAKPSTTHLRCESHTLSLTNSQKPCMCMFPLTLVKVT